MEIIYTDKAPEPIGPYSQGIAIQDFIFLSGQIGIDPKTNELVKGEIEEETSQVIENIKAVLEEVGSGLDKVIKVDVYLADLKDFGLMNKVYERYFSKSKPARVTIGVDALPKSAKVEISVIALK